jgi:hypothetical protein
MNQRHTEFFGPDLARGPFGSSRIETTTIAIATALAQLRAPLSRNDADIRTHVDFIRELADRLAPDWAAQIGIDVGNESGDTITSSIAAVTGTYSLLECWLADSVGGGLTLTAPTTVTWSGGVVLTALTDKKHYKVITPSTGAVNVTVGYAGSKNWYWAVSRYGRAYYSSQLHFA